MTDFYSAPILSPSSLPGDLVRMRPTFVPQLPRAGAAWQILYVSTNTRGDLIPASGTVILPDTDTDVADNASASGLGPGDGGLLVYYPVFHGLGGRATSQMLAVGDESDTAEISTALDQGWIVAVPDGEGLGVTGLGPHTFLAAHAGGQIVLDLARAAQAVPVLETGRWSMPSMPVVAWGYADGGRAVAAAAELHPRYAPELDLRGVCAGAVASDLTALAPALASGPFAALGLAALVGLSQAYPHQRLRHVLTEEGQHTAADAETLTDVELFDRYPQPLSHWCQRPDPWNDLMWRHVLEYERLAHAAPIVPLHLYHGHNDEIVPVRAGLRTLIAYRQRGAQVTWSQYDTGHTGTALAAITDVLNRLADYLVRVASPGPVIDGPASVVRP
ncbi:lipase family protein [Nocardia wallacei]|uniref:lipase family protein n=1 Tax=Nocardia wallacei TaxID=480035 RepID=UPI0024590249|nr:lipase family protein [Nocardia wallacei]